MEPAFRNVRVLSAMPLWEKFVTRQPDSVSAGVAVRRTGIAMKASSAKVVNAVVVGMLIADCSRREGLNCANPPSDSFA